MEFLFQKDLRNFAAPFGMKGVALVNISKPKTRNLQIFISNQKVKKNQSNSRTLTAS